VADSKRGLTPNRFYRSDTEYARSRKEPKVKNTPYGGISHAGGGADDLTNQWASLAEYVAKGAVMKIGDNNGEMVEVGTPTQLRINAIVESPEMQKAIRALRESASTQLLFSKDVIADKVTCTYTTPCYTCKGAGKLAGVVCLDCNGTGRLTIEEEVNDG